MKEFIVKGKHFSINHVWFKSRIEEINGAGGTTNL